MQCEKDIRQIYSVQKCLFLHTYKYLFTSTFSTSEVSVFLRRYTGQLAGKMPALKAQPDGGEAIGTVCPVCSKWILPHLPGGTERSFWWEHHLLLEGSSREN